MVDNYREKSVLFVCLGNICRSPTAEAVFTHKARQAGLNLRIDSAGTQGFHRGAKPDKRSMEIGAKRGYSFDGIRSRRVDSKDFSQFDLILAMDSHNFEDLCEASPPEARQKIKMFLEFAEVDDKDVPDPYYGGAKGFEYVLDLIEQGADALVNHLRRG